MGIKKTQKQFEDEVYKLYGDEYIVTGIYESNKKNISVYHRRCNREIMVNPYHLLHGHGCRKCACAHLRDERRKTTEELQKELDEMYDFEFEVVTEYDTAKTDITIRHKRCGELITKKPNRILSKKFTCPNCRKYKSKGEIKIEKILKNNDILAYDNLSFSNLSSRFCISLMRFSSKASCIVSISCFLCSSILLSAPLSNIFLTLRDFMITPLFIVLST